MSTVNHDRIRATVVQRIKALAPTRYERAAILGRTPRYLDMLERGRIPQCLIDFIAAGVVPLPVELDEAHDDTKGADE